MKRFVLSALVGALVVFGGLAAFNAWNASGEALPEVTVFMSPTCGCCGDWVAHLEEEGFAVTERQIMDTAPVKQRLSVPRTMASCHTAVVDGYVVEGHVPADEVKRLLRERPDVTGLAVPGMPIGSPGMEVPGRPADPYDVLAFGGEGGTTVFAQYD